MTPDPPLYPGLPVLGSLLDFRGDRAALLRKASALGPVVRFQVGPRRLTLLADPELAGHVVSRHHENYTKDVRIYDLFRDALGEGMLTTDGARWARSRRMATPAFRHEAVAGFAAVMAEHARRLVEAWAPEREVDAGPGIQRMAMGIAGRTLLGDAVEGRAEPLRVAFEHALRRTTERVLAPWSPPLWLPTPANRRFQREIGTLDAVLGGIIRARRATAEGDDLLGSLLRARDDDGSALDDATLLSEVKTLFVAGFETVSNALQWTLYELGRHPAWQERVRAEARAALAASNVPDLRALPVTRQVFLETLRRYPPVWAVTRAPVADDVIGGFHVPAGSWVFVSPIVLHHLPGHWPDPDRWDPDRFAPGRAEGRHRYAFMPFLAGPRRCIGEHYALLEGVLVTAIVAAALSWETVGEVTPEPVVTLRPRSPVRLRIRRATGTTPDSAAGPRPGA